MEPSRKRVRDEQDEDGATISTLTSASPVIKVEGAIVNISPIKKESWEPTISTDELATERHPCASMDTTRKLGIALWTAKVGLLCPTAKY